MFLSVNVIVKNKSCFKILSLAFKLVQEGKMSYVSYRVLSKDTVVFRYSSVNDVNKILEEWSPFDDKYFLVSETGK